MNFKAGFDQGLCIYESRFLAHPLDEVVLKITFKLYFKAVVFGKKLNGFDIYMHLADAFK